MTSHDKQGVPQTVGCSFKSHTFNKLFTSSGDIYIFFLLCILSVFGTIISFRIIHKVLSILSYCELGF